ncbi:photosynthetic protein synthase I [Sphingobacterium sp. SGR-19]|uniref:photosynthetic protein synthase I n=1 Tax=Sphingobacterium sp. SGR-19 TaxID=2710886 RepID=UPI0013EE2ED1|nr:photosynthetic protein synthase I [Sphingobacterium sp. SGR-19]NGM64689.1 photosynthetic protein synthase I [Sphingobacterium sp. SGR-19]
MSKRAHRNKSTLIILALILLVPGFLYIAVNRLGFNEYASLPVFGEKTLSGEMKRNWGRAYPDTIFHMVPHVHFEEVSNTKVMFPAPDTCISVAHLFYTRDVAFSRLMLDHVDMLATRFQENPIVNFFSISVDSMDTQADVSAFIEPYKNMAQKHWNVVYSPSVDIFTYAREELLIDAMPDPTDSTRFLISNQLVLLDSKGRIRGFYDISLKGEVDRLEDEIKLLAVEEIRNKPLKVEKKPS